MPTPTGLTDFITLLAVLLGSITAGIIFMRPQRSRHAARDGRRDQNTRTERALPRMLGGDIFGRDTDRRP